MVRSRPTLTAAQLAAIIDAMPTGVVVVDAAGRIGWVNAQAERLFGYAGPELYGIAVEMLMPVRFRAQHNAFRSNSLRLRAHAPWAPGVISSHCARTARNSRPRSGSAP